MSDEPRTLYVGNLPHQITEELIYNLFIHYGVVVTCKMISSDPNSSDPYCFVEYDNHESAKTALNTMNGRVILEKPMKVNWATSPNSKNNMASDTPPGTKKDTTDHFNVFCGDLSPEITSKELLKTFSAFGEVSDCKVITDPESGKSKGYGFISFPIKENAQRAIDELNGAWLGQRVIRTNWAAGRANTDNTKRQNTKPNYDLVCRQTPDTNCTVYIGNIQSNLTREVIEDTFESFKPLYDIRVFPDKGYAFCRFKDHETAAQAICQVHNSEVNGYTVRCNWGKEDTSSGASRGGGYNNYQQGGGYNYNQGYGYGGQQGYGGSNQQGYGGYDNQWGGGQWGGQWATGDQNWNQGYDSYNQGGGYG